MLSARRACSLFVLVSTLVLFLTGCGGGKRESVISEVDPPLIERDVTLASLTISEGTVTQVKSGARIQVAGDATLAGTLVASGGPAVLEVLGNLTLDGVIRSTDTDARLNDGTTAIVDGSTGIFLIVGGNLTMSEDAVLSTNGSILVSDDGSLLEQTGTGIWEQGRIATALPERAAHQDPVVDTIVIRGTHDNSAQVSKDRSPFVLFRFVQAVNLTVEGVTLRAPKPIDGKAQDSRSTPGTPAVADSGGNGLFVRFDAASGSLAFLGANQITLGRGGDGGKAMAVAANATGGDGGQAGYLFLQGGAIDLSQGTLQLFPSRGGRGGDAIIQRPLETVAPACPGIDGNQLEAIGGNGGSNLNVITVVSPNAKMTEKITITDIRAGHGGDANCDAPNGSDGGPVCSGGHGGSATARGGQGAKAEIALFLDEYNLTGKIYGGHGGDAQAAGGWGGNGSFSSSGAAGGGGLGGDAIAFGGAGGQALGGLTEQRRAGSGGDATTIAGNGGNGGSTETGTPGVGASAGALSAVAGNPGQPNGVQGLATAIPGRDGTPGTIGTTPAIGDRLRVSLDRLPVGPLVPGVHELELVDANDELRARVQLLIEQLDATGRVDLREEPVRHLEVTGGVQLRFLLETIVWIGTPVVQQIVGWKFRLLFAAGVSLTNPITLDYLVNNVSLFGGPAPVVTSDVDAPLSPQQIGDIINASIRPYLLPKDESIDESVFRVPVGASAGFLEWSLPLPPQ